MRAILQSISLVTALLCGCSALPPSPASTAPPFTAVVSVRQLMEWVIDPAVDVIWDSVATIYTEAGTREVAPHTDEQWAAVRNSAVIVAESGNLLMLDGRAMDRDRWMSTARELTVAANGALKAAEARNVAALFTAGEDIYHACTACHLRYAPGLRDATPDNQAK
jgi:hypothetical protein